MNILWIAQKDLMRDIDSASWLEMVKAMSRQDHAVTLVVLSTSSRKCRPDEPNLHIIELPVIRIFPFVSVTFHLQVLLYSLYWLLKEREDAVITHPITALFLVPTIMICRILKRHTRFILDIRTLPVRSRGISGKFKELLHRISYYLGKHIYDGITVITPALKNYLINEFNLNHINMGIWMSGVDTTLFNPANYNGKHEQADSFVVMYHGSIADNRGIIETVEAMKLINRSHPAIRLLILGKGNAVDTIKRLIDESNIKNIAIHYTMDHDRIPEYISGADIGIIPLPDLWCWRVSSPLKLFEYLAMAKPVIVSTIEAHTNVLGTSQACFYLASSKPEDIARAIVSAYEKRSLLKESGQVGREFIMNNFTWDHQAKSLLNYITEVSLKRSELSHE